MEILRKAFLILVPNAGIYRDKKSDCVRQWRNNAIQSLGNNDNIHSNERVRERFILRDSESLFFREIVYLQCYVLRAAKIFGR